MQAISVIGSGLFTASLIIAGASDSATVETTFGTLKGRTLSNGVEEYLGVPFATAERWGNPVDWSRKWMLPREALTAMPGCDIDSAKHPGFSEDCLYLNVWRSPGKGPLPILFWIYGGAFVSGEATQYNFSILAAKQPAVYITANYRLGIFGWLSTTNCTADANCEANFGLKDQQSAMRWANREGPAFGGDTSRFMLFGESAGAISTLLHVITPQSTGLFTHALLESSCGTSAGMPKNLAAIVTAIFNNALGCAVGDLACMRKKPLLEVLEASRKVVPYGNPFDIVLGVGPVIDGTSIPDELALLLGQGRFNTNVSVIVGTNTNEGTLFAWNSLGDHATMDDYRNFITKTLGHGQPVPDKIVNKVVGKYPGSLTPGDANREMASAILGDLSFICPSKLAAELLSVRSRQPIYKYRFNYRALHDSEPKGYGVWHSSEIPFVLDQGTWSGGFTAEEEKFSEQIGAAWVLYAATGRPVPGWPAYENASDAEQVLMPGEWRPEENWRADYCDFWMHICDNHFCDSNTTDARTLLQPRLPLHLLMQYHETAQKSDVLIV